MSFTAILSADTQSSVRVDEEQIQAKLWRQPFKCAANLEQKKLKPIEYNTFFKQSQNMLPDCKVAQALRNEKKPHTRTKITH